jgi:hypothetical protein
MQKFIRTTFLLGMVVFSQSLFGQVGINTKNPNATLDITPKTTDGSKPEGLLIPQLDGNALKTAAYGTAQKGVIVYAKSEANPTDAKTVNVTAEGYYYFDGSVWQKMNSAAAGDTTNDAWINDTNNGLVKLGTKADGTTRTAGTDFVAKDNGQIGLGTSTPDSSAALDITANNKGLLIPRVALTGITDQTTIPSPASGLIAYNTSTNINGPGLVFNRGTSSSPKWSSVQIYSSDAGAISGKLVYQSYPDANKTMSVGNLEFRAIYSGDTYYFQIRRLTPPSTTITYYCDRIGWFSPDKVYTTTAVLSFNSSNYSTWQTYTSGLISPLYGVSVGFLTYISSASDSLYYRINNHSKFDSNSFTAFIVDAF